MGIEDDIREAETSLERIQTRLDTYLRAFLRDGVISDDEQSVLDRVTENLNQMGQSLTVLRAQNGGQAQASGSGQSSSVSTQLSSGTPFSSDTFFNAFKDSIEDWAASCHRKFTDGLAYMIREETPSGLTASDAISLVSLVLPSSAIVGVADKAVPVVQHAFNSALPASDPTVNEIHRSWVSAMDALIAFNKTKWFQSFVAEWKRQNQIPGTEERDTTGKFNRACLDYAENHLPNPADMQRAFVAALLNKVEDTWDWDENLIEGMPDAGSAEIRFRFDGRKFNFVSGQLDDVPASLLQAVKTVFKGESIIDLPVSIVIILVSDEKTTYLSRTSKKPGNTTFKISRNLGASKEHCEIFIAQNAILSIKVGQLTLDK